MRFMRNRFVIAAVALVVVAVGALVWVRSGAARPGDPLVFGDGIATRNEDAGDVSGGAVDSVGTGDVSGGAVNGGAAADGRDPVLVGRGNEEPSAGRTETVTDGGTGGETGGSDAAQSGGDPQPGENTADTNSPNPDTADSSGPSVDSGGLRGSTPPFGVPATPHTPVAVPDDGTADPDAAKANVDLPALFYPVAKEPDKGVPADLLIEHLLASDPAVVRDEQTGSFRLIGYADGDVYEIKTLAEGGFLATLTYRFPTGRTSRRGDLIYNEAKERPRLEDALEYLFPEQFDAVWNDFTSMRYWEEFYLRAYGLTEPDWSAFVRSRAFGTRYCRMAVTRDTVTVTVYPDGYRDANGDFAPDGSYREFYTYPVK